MIFDLTFNYSDSTLSLQTQQFDSVESVKQTLIFDNTNNVVIYDVDNVSHLVYKNFSNVILNWMEENQHQELILVKENPQEVIMPEESITPEILSSDETLPEIPTKFKSFREFFQEQNRIRGNWLNSIAEKMAKGNELLGMIDTKLDQENDAVENLQKKFLGK